MPAERGERDEFVYLSYEDALEVYAAIIGGTGLPSIGFIAPVM